MARAIPQKLGSKESKIVSIHSLIEDLKSVDMNVTQNSPQPVLTYVKKSLNAQPYNEQLDVNM